MGEAKRRKKLDPTFGQSQLIIHGRTEEQMRRELDISMRRWIELKPYIRVVDTSEDVDDSITGLWFYLSEDGRVYFSVTQELAAHFALTDRL